MLNKMLVALTLSILSSNVQAEVRSIAFTGPLAIQAGHCVRYDVSLLSYLNLQRGSNVTLSFPIKHSAGGRFYSNNICSYPISSVSFSAGIRSKAVYLKVPMEGLTSIVVGDPQGEMGILGDTQLIQVGPPSPSALSQILQNVMKQIHVVQSAFYAEYEEYTTYLYAAGFDNRDFLTNRKFQFGFSQPNPLRENTLSMMPMANSGGIRSMPWFADTIEFQFPSLAMSVSSDRVFQNMASAHCPNRICSANLQGYSAIGFGNIDSDSTMDVWLIDQSGQLTHVVDDLVR